MAHHILPGLTARPCAAQSAALAGLRSCAAQASPPKPAPNMTARCTFQPGSVTAGVADADAEVGRAGVTCTEAASVAAGVADAWGRAVAVASGVADPVAGRPAAGAAGSVTASVEGAAVAGAAVVGCALAGSVSAAVAEDVAAWCRVADAAAASTDAVADTFPAWCGVADAAASSTDADAAANVRSGADAVGGAAGSFSALRPALRSARLTRWGDAVSRPGCWDASSASGGGGERLAVHPGAPAADARRPGPPTPRPAGPADRAAEHSDELGGGRGGGCFRGGCGCRY